MSRYARAYHEGLVIALLLSWSPSNLLAYGAPFLMLGWYIVRTRSKTVVRNLILVGMLWLAFILAHLPFIGDFAWVAALLTGLTYSAFIPILVIPTRFLVTDQLFPRIQRWAVGFVLLEGVWGITQALYGYAQAGTFDLANGDLVEGTIHPGLESETSFANPMFAANMAILLLVLLPTFITRRKYFVAIGIGAVSLILASVVHILLFLAVAGIVVGLLYGTQFLRRWSGWLFVMVALLAGLLATSLLSRNLNAISTFVSTTVRAETPRGVVVKRVFETMPQEYPLMPLFGLGPGQFSSRAALIVTGQYFANTELPLPVQMSEPMADYIWQDFLRARAVRYYGSTQQPAFSLLSFYTEMGAIAFLLLVLLIMLLLLRIRRRARTYSEQVLAMALSIGILFIAFLGIQENYWEVPQAIFPALLILKAMYVHLLAR